MFVFFVFKQKAAYEVRISDWSSDVFSSDLTPLEQFTRWFNEALDAKVIEPTAMTLASVGADGRPSARTVLLKGFDERGFVFFTNYDSRKGGELIANPHASLLFFWPELERQVRIEGQVEKTADTESDTYYSSRPLGSRVGAWASPQRSAERRVGKKWVSPCKS